MSLADVDLISSYVGLLTLATGSVWAGAFASLPNPKKKHSKDGQEEDEEDVEEVVERMTKEDAWMFPIIGSVVLLSLYLVVKYLGKEWVNWVLGWYFGAVGIASCWKSSVAFLRFLLGPRYRQFKQYNYSFKWGKDITVLKWRTPSLLLLPLAAVPSLVFTFYPEGSALLKAAVNNILALSLSYNALALLRVDSFATGTILLSGLFLYDIWWVFGTDVMVSVATSLDLPMKILWPKSLVFSGARGFTLLGLGDIVIPGTFVALGLRYDHHKHQAGGQVGTFKKPYFKAALFAYFAGLATTMVVMHVFKAAQPALLYLSPACILSFLATGLVRGELKEAWSWSDDPEAEKEEKEQKEKAKTE